MTEFIYLASLDIRSIGLQIIKSFSILILSINKAQTLYYLFSNNFINQIMSNDFEKYDEEFVSHYVNFLKSLISKLDIITIQFFFHKNFNSFPLCTSALKLYNYPDGMIKNTVRNILLGLLKLRYDPLVDYFCTLPAITYFSFISLSLRDLIIKLNDEIMSNDSTYSGLLSVQDDIIIDILFIQDIFSLNIIKITNILINTLFYYTILPLLAGSIVSVSKPKIAISTALYTITLLFQNITNESFNNCLYSVIFFPKISRKINRYIKNYPKNLYNYFQNWVDQKKASCQNYTEYITSNFSEPFIYSIVSYNTNINGEEVFSDYKEINELKTKIRKIIKESFDLGNPNHYQPVLQEILRPFQRDKIDEMIAYHKTVSIASGVNVGLFNDNYKRHSFTSMMHKLFYKIKIEKQISNNIEEQLCNTNNSENPLLQLHYINNEVRQNILSYLTSKDDSLILLVSLLIYSTQNKNISHELQSYSGLLKADFHSNYNLDTHQILNEVFSNIGRGVNQDDSSTTPVINNSSKDANKSLIVDDDFCLINPESISNKKGTSSTNLGLDNFPTSTESQTQEIIDINQIYDYDLLGETNKPTSNNRQSIGFFQSGNSELAEITDQINSSLLKPGHRTKDLVIDKENVMGFYLNIPKDPIIFDNPFFTRELSEFDQISYDHSIVDALLDVIII